MPNYCQLTVIGHLTRDPEPKAVGEHRLAEFGVGWNRKRKGESIASFIECKAWNQTADVACQFLRKGAPVHLVGTLEQEHWNDRDTGAKRSKFVFSIERLTLLGAPQRAEGTDAPTAAAWPDSGDDGPRNIPF